MALMLHEAIADEIRLEQAICIDDWESVVQCPRCGENMEMGCTADSQSYPGIRICFNCADQELFSKNEESIDGWFFTEILKKEVIRQMEV